MSKTDQKENGLVISLFGLIWDAFAGGFRALPTLSILSYKFGDAFGQFIRGLIEKWNEFIPKLWKIFGLEFNAYEASVFALIVTFIPIFLIGCAQLFTQKDVLGGNESFELKAWAAVGGLSVCVLGLTLGIITGIDGLTPALSSLDKILIGDLPMFMLILWCVALLASYKSALWTAAWIFGLIMFDRCDFFLGSTVCGAAADLI